MTPTIKIVENFGMWPEQDVEEGFDEKGFDEYVEKCKEQYGEKTTQGCFAPWLIHKKDLEKIGGHDYRFKSAREDSAILLISVNGLLLIFRVEIVHLLLLNDKQMNSKTELNSYHPTPYD